MLLIISLVAKMEVVKPTPLTTILRETVTQSTGNEDEICDLASVAIAGELDSVIPQGSKLLLLWDEGCKLPRNMRISMENALVQQGFLLVQRGSLLFGKDQRSATLETQDSVLISTILDEGNGKWFQHLSKYGFALPSADYILVIKPLEYKYKEKKGRPENMWFKASFSLIDAKSYIKAWGGYIAYERMRVKETRPAPVVAKTQPQQKPKAKKRTSDESLGCSMSSTTVGVIIGGAMIAGAMVLFLVAQ